jgi:murein DD-endopeptidase MepM/ murein hydrolase activator NlpD
MKPCYNSRVRRLTRIAGAVAALVLLTPVAAGAYSWPLRPFYKPHPIRGYFNDPRLSGPTGKSFHFGIDIVAKDLEPVYAVEPGRAYVRSRSVAIRSKARRTLSYWHVVPAVTNRQLVRSHQVIGWIAPGAEHLHFAENRRGIHVNPLRLGGIAPFIDDTAPLIKSLQFYVGAVRVPPEVLVGFVDVTVDACDVSPLPIPPKPWESACLAPTLIRWRVVLGQRTILPWRQPIDFRTFLVPPGLFSFVYTPGTYQNKPAKPGRYEYFLARGFDTRTLVNRSYVLQIEAWDAQENIGRAAFPFTVRNLPPT